MNEIEFSRQPASIWNGISDPKKHKEFQEAAMYAIRYGKDNPLKLMPAKFKPLFKKQD
jgi:hypothetical protein